MMSPPVTHPPELELEVYGWIWREVSRLPCVARGHPAHSCGPPGPGHHVKTVGSGGRDYENVIPCCYALHMMCHGAIWGWTQRRVEEEFQLDLKQLAKEATQQVLGLGPLDLAF